MAVEPIALVAAAQRLGQVLLATAESSFTLRDACARGAGGLGSLASAGALSEFGTSWGAVLVRLADRAEALAAGLRTAGGDYAGIDAGLAVLAARERRPAPPVWPRAR